MWFSEQKLSRAVIGVLDLDLGADIQRPWQNAQNGLCDLLEVKDATRRLILKRVPKVRPSGKKNSKEVKCGVGKSPVLVSNEFFYEV